MINNELTFSEQKTQRTLYQIIGRKILESRKSSRKKLEGISKKLNINIKILRMIESGDIERIRNDIPVNGFIRAFAKAVDADISEEFQSLSLNYIVSNDIDIKKKVTEISEIRTSQILIVFISSFCFLLLVLYFLSISEDKSEEIMTSNLNPLEEHHFNSNASGQLTTKHDENDLLSYEDQSHEDVFVDNQIKQDFFEIIFLEETWIEVYDKNRSLLEFGLFRIGQSLNFEFETRESDFFIKSGNLGGFQIFFNNNFFAPFGSSGEVSKGFFVKEKILRIKELDI